MAYRVLEVTLLSAKDLKNVNLITRMEVYAVATISGDPITRQCTLPDPYGGRNPTWNATLRFDVPPTAEEAKGRCLHILLRAERPFSPDRDVGEVIVPLPEVLTDGGLGAPNMPQFASYQVRKVHRTETRGLLYLTYRLGPIVVPPPANKWPVVGYPAQQETPPQTSSSPTKPLSPKPTSQVPPSPVGYATAPSKSDGHVAVLPSPKPTGQVPLSPKPTGYTTAPSKSKGHVAVPPSPKLTGQVPPSPKPVGPSKSEGHVAMPPSPKPTGQVPPSPKPSWYATTPSKSEGHVAMPPSPKPTRQVVSMPPSPKPSTNPSGQFVSMRSSPKPVQHVVPIPPPSPKPAGHEVSMPPSPKPAGGHVAMLSSPKPFGGHASPTPYGQVVGDRIFTRTDIYRFPIMQQGAATSPSTRPSTC
ncbi:hypothetical protein ACQ4PT_012078 [Festuca glaucescens]